MTVEYSATTRGRSTKMKALLVGIGYPNGVEGNGQAVLDPIPTSIPNVKKFKEFIQGELFLSVHCTRNSDGPFVSSRPLGLCRRRHYSDD
jgi:hypothetical protein